MKKILALTLAAVMAAGMSTVAFADRDDNLVIKGSTTDEVVFYYDSNDDGEIEDWEKVTGEDNLAKNSRIDGETTIYVPIYDYETNKVVTDKDMVSGWKVYTSWDINKTDKAKIDRVKIDGKYVYAVYFTLPTADEIKGTDLAGEIVIYSSTHKKDENNDLRKIEVGMTYGYAETPYDDEIDNLEVVSFKGIDDVVNMTVGDIFEFEVDVTGQGKLNLKNNQDFNKEFAAMYDYANIDFLTFEMEPTFNKIGTVYIYADEDAYIYEVTADGAKEIKGLEWDEDYEAWTFRTRTLGSYAISDVELDEKTVTEDKDDTTTDDGKVNPDTGR